MKAVAQGKGVVETDTVANDLGRKTVTGVDGQKGANQFGLVTPGLS